jgi:hypothetical protein
VYVAVSDRQVDQVKIGDKDGEDMMGTLSHQQYIYTIPQLTHLTIITFHGPPG